MSKRIAAIVLGLCLAAAVSGCGESAAGPTPDPAAKAASHEPRPERPLAPDFTLPDVEGKEHSLASHRGKHVVLEWINHGCPFVKKHYTAGTMQNLQKRYAEKDVVWLSICSSAPGKQGHMSAGDWRKRNAEVGTAATAVLIDPGGEVGRLYGAARTPHMVVIGPSGALLYQGAIDDRPREFEPEKVRTAKNYVALVLDAVLAGKEPPVEKTTAYGCSVKY